MDPQKEDAIHQEREIRIICIGAGASGLCFAYKFQRSFRNFSLVASSRIGLTNEFGHFLMEQIGLREELRCFGDVARK
jgi:ribulose 1,5-bisphosphate synthetase/thiazole synthase